MEEHISSKRSKFQEGTHIFNTRNIILIGFSEQVRNVKAAQRAASPSTGALVSNFQAHQSGAAKILNGRPIENLAPPLGLYHPVFDDYLECRKSEEEVPLLIKKDVQKYMELSAKIYSSEAERFDNIKEVLTNLIGPALDVSARKVKSDGIMAMRSLNTHAYYLIVEIGTGAVDPLTQASLAYQKYYSAEDRV